MVMLPEHSHTGEVKFSLDRSRNRTSDLLFAGQILCRPSYEVNSVRVSDISKWIKPHSVTHYTNNKRRKQVNKLTAKNNLQVTRNPTFG